MKAENKRTLKQDLHLIRRALKLINTLTPHFLFHVAFFSFCCSAWSIGTNYITASIVDELTGERRIKILIILLSCYLAEIVFRVIRDYSWRRIRTFQIISSKWEDMLLNAKSFEMDYRNTEDPSVRAKRQMITDRGGNGESGFGELFFQLLRFSRGFFDLLMCSAVTLPLFFKHTDRILSGGERIIDSAFFTLAFFVAVFALSYIQYKINIRFSKKVVKAGQEKGRLQSHLHYYFDEYLDDSKAAKDVHIFNQKKLINHSFNRFYDEWEKQNKLLCVSDRNRDNCYNLFYILSNALTHLYVALKVYAGTLGIGGFLKYQYCISHIMDSVFRFSDCFSRMRANNDYLELFFDYLDMPSEMRSGEVHIESRSGNDYEIEFHNVSFRYPGSDVYAIKNFTFRFKAGERVAVVGMNGSGKTTMIKLLCRLYDPTEGYITLNGIDIREYNYEDYLTLFSVVFQDFRLFSFSIGENVACKKEYDAEKALQCLNTAGLEERLQRIDNNLDAVVYKDFDDNGIEISGGEAQKIAIARALYKDAPFVILDEPTASLDPLAEYEIYSRFNDMVKNKTAVYISHRLSSCRFCDRIAVFHEGEMIQLGTHEGLLESTEGKYYELWNAQAQYYVGDAG